MLSPKEMLDKIRSSAKLDENEYGNQIAIKFNKPGRVKLQLLALDSEHLFKARTQHFIPTLPNNDDPNEKIMVVDCKGEGCPVCAAATAFKNSGIKVEDVNAAYNPRYPYPKLRNVFTQPEHFLLCARILADQAEDGKYLPKDAELGSTQLIQLSKSALNSLMSSYEDFITDYDDDIEELPPLFGIFEDGADKVKSFTVNLRIQVSGSWSYLFTLGKAVEVSFEDVDKDKLKLLEEMKEPTDDYVEKAVKRIHDIQNYFIGDSSSTYTTAKTKLDEVLDKDDDLPFSMEETKVTSNDIEDDDDFDLETL